MNVFFVSLGGATLNIYERRAAFGGLDGEGLNLS